MIVDDATGFVKSLNWETKNLTVTRDYAVVTDHKHEVAEMIDCFEADWKRKDFNAGADARLIWCTGNGRERIAQFIDAAKHSIFLQNERYQDAVIIERLVRARMRGVKVHVMARPPHKLKKEKLTESVGGLRTMEDVGIKIHKLKHLKLHAKMLLADDKRAIVGSINLAPGSFDSRRELAIEVENDDVVKRIGKIAHHDWKHSHALDLTDEGLAAELARHKIECAEELALNLKAQARSKNNKN
jgi:phosphatidylserine/phosphatidylglycerophosphate/cardiolipin synthase-like enzyme